MVLLSSWVEISFQSPFMSVTDVMVFYTVLSHHGTAFYKNRIFFHRPIFLTCRTEHEPVCIFQPRSALHPAELERPLPRFFIYFFLQSTVFVSSFIFRFLPGMASLWYFRNILNFQTQLLTFGTFLFKSLAFV